MEGLQLSGRCFDGILDGAHAEMGEVERPGRRESQAVSSVRRLEEQRGVLHQASKVWPGHKQWLLRDENAEGEAGLNGGSPLGHAEF